MTVAGIAVFAVLACAALFALSKDSFIFGERTFVCAPHDGSKLVDVYVEVEGIDAVRQALRLRIDVASGPGAHGTHYYGTSARDLDLRISDGSTEQDVAIRRNARVPSTTFEAGLQGAVARYPFDRYFVRTLITAWERSPANGSRAVPLRVALWDDQPAWALRVGAEKPSASGPAIALNFNLRRATPLVLFASAMYAVMILVAGAALVIAAVAASDPARVEATLIGALAAMVFALPALRNTLPGAPPLGVQADVFIFLWAQIGVVVGLAALVFAWARKGAKSRR